MTLLTTLSKGNFSQSKCLDAVAVAAIVEASIVEAAAAVVAAMADTVVEDIAGAVAAAEVAVDLSRCPCMVDQSSRKQEASTCESPPKLFVRSRLSRSGAASPQVFLIPT